MILLAAIALAGWWLELPRLRSLLPGALQMKASTALDLILAGTSLYLQAAEPSPRRSGVARGFAWLALLSGLATLCGYLLGWPLGLDQWLHDAGQPSHPIARQMSPYAAAGIVVAGVALASLSRPSLKGFVMPGAIVAASIGAASLLGYLWDTSEMTAEHVLPPMAFPTAAAFVFLGLGIWWEQRNRPLSQSIDEPGAGHVETKVLTGFIAALALLYLAGGITYRMGVSFADSAQWMLATQQARATLGDLYASVSDAEAAQRNYLLTRAPDYKAEFVTGVVESRTQLEALRALLGAQTSLQGPLRNLGSNISGRIEALSQQVAVFDESGGDPATLAIASDEGVNSLKSIRELIHDMDLAEQGLLTVRATELARTRALTLFALLVTLTIATTALVLLFHSITRDIRERARIARALDQAQREAQRATRAKSEFLAAMSHEIRTPMNGVIGMIDVLHQSSLAGPQIEMVSLIRESADALLTIIDDVLDFSKIEAGKIEIEHAPISIADVVEKTCSLMNRLAERKNGTLTVFVDPALPARVLGDDARLRQVLVNLIGNAIKFSSGLERTGRVEVRVNAIPTQGAGLMVEFRVIDNGIGMDAPTVAKTFTSFMQADASTTRKYGGTGLGLAISKQLALLMGGDIQIESALGQGSTFTLRLPFTPPSVPSGADPPPLLERLTCLVIGAPGGMANDLASYLSADSATVVRASDLVAAREWARGHDPGPIVWVVDAGEELLNSAELEQFVRTRSDPSLRAVIVLVGRGPRRNAHAEAGGLLIIDGNALTRQSLSRAVAIAAGRIQPEPGALVPQRHAARSPQPSRSEAAARRRLILVAEDNEINQKVIRQQLELLGYAADVASTGREALERLRSGEYALLLTDLHMPEMDGYDLTLAVRLSERGGARLPIVALTANALQGESERCRSVGMDDYLSKPAALTELAALLERWLPIARQPPAAGAVPVEVAELEALVGRDPQIIREVLLEFRESAARLGSELIDACIAGKVAEAASVAHKLKSSARSVGALHLGELCVAVESAGLADDAEACSTLLPQFQRELAAVLAHLDGSQTVQPSSNQRCA